MNNNWIFILLAVVASSVLVSAHFEDVRCKCVCPSIKPENSTRPSRKVIVKSFNEPEKCKCEYVVPEELKATRLNFCDLCECKWQRRNTTTIMVVVIIIICLISGLFLYMLFLLCLDPFMSRRPKSYLEQQNEEVNLDTQSIHRESIDEGAGARARSGALISRVQHGVSKVRGEQQKWKGQVQEQRRHIFDRHTMLN